MDLKREEMWRKLGGVEGGKTDSGCNVREKSKF